MEQREEGLTFDLTATVLDTNLHIYNYIRMIWRKVLFICFVILPITITTAILESSDASQYLRNFLQIWITLLKIETKQNVRSDATSDAWQKTVTVILCLIFSQFLSNLFNLIEL